MAGRELVFIADGNTSLRAIVSGRVRRLADKVFSASALGFGCSFACRKETN